MGKGYIINLNAIDNLKSTRNDYEKTKKVQLDKKPSNIGRPICLGGTDIEARSNQIKFLESMFCLLTENLNFPKEASNKLPVETLIAIHSMIAVYLFVDSKLESGTLKKLLKKKLNITENNPLETEDRLLCLMSAQNLIYINNVFIEINNKLARLGKAPLSLKDWTEFQEFIQKNSKSTELDKKASYFLPCTTFSSYLFGQVGEYAGASAGLLAGSIFSKSTHLMPVKYYITTGISTIVVIMHASSPLAISITAPIVAGYILENFCKISMAHIGSVFFKMLGKILGTCIGLPMDFVLHLMIQLGKICHAAIGSKEEELPLSGFNIRDGKPYINGQEASMYDESNLDGIPMTELHVFIDEKGKTIITEHHPDPKIQLHTAPQIVEDYDTFYSDINDESAEELNL